MEMLEEALALQCSIKEKTERLDRLRAGHYGKRSYILKAMEISESLLTELQNQFHLVVAKLPAAVLVNNTQDFAVLEGASEFWIGGSVVLGELPRKYKMALRTLCTNHDIRFLEKGDLAEAVDSGSKPMSDSELRHLVSIIEGEQIDEAWSLNAEAMRLKAEARSVRAEASRIRDISIKVKKAITSKVAKAQELGEFARNLRSLKLSNTVRLNRLRARVLQYSSEIKGLMENDKRSLEVQRVKERRSSFTGNGLGVNHSGNFKKRRGGRVPQ